MKATVKLKKGAPAGEAIPSELVKAKPKADVVEIPARLALALDGAAGPDSDEFGRAIGALYGVVYTLKFARKRERGDTFKVPPLEGRWWAEGWSDESRPPPRELWRWRLRIGVPFDVTDAEVKTVIAGLVAKKGGRLEGSAEARQVRLERIARQKCGRILHVGPYADEPRSFAAIAEALKAAGLTQAYSHLEVYLGDPRRTAPARLKTVLLRELA